MTELAQRFNINVSGAPGGRPIVFAHGFGCDQNMWRFVAPAFEANHTVVLFDHIGCGRSDATAFDPDEYSNLDRYADDVISVVADLDLGSAVFVGHSVSATMGVLASIKRPELFAALVLLGPSPRYVNDDGYVGGFERTDIDALLESLASNYLGWSRSMASVIVAHDHRPELSDELVESFCRVEPSIALQFARVTFLGDNRSDLTDVAIPTLIVQCSDDAIAPVEVGEFVQRSIAGSELAMIETAGHCPHLTDPRATIDAITSFLDRRLVGW
jgi:sigma-B regulation protein RsbQ